MTAETPAADRCPKCGAAVRPDDPWCSLCYTDLRPPAPEPEPELAPEPDADTEQAPNSDANREESPGSDSVPGTDTEPESAPQLGVVAPGVTASPDPVTPPEGEPAEAAGPTWPCTACGESNPLARVTCAACGTPFLGGLRGQERPLLDLPVVGDITKLGRGHRMALAAGVVLAFILLTLIVGLIFG